MVLKDIEANRTSAAVRQVGSKPFGVMPCAVDPKAADRPWSLSEQLLGIVPSPPGAAP